MMEKQLLFKGMVFSITFVIIYSLKTNKNPNKLHTFTAFQTFKNVKSITWDSQKQ